MKRLISLSLMFMLAACTAQPAVEPMIELAATAVPPTATVAQVVVEPTAVPTNPPASVDESVQVEPTQLPATELPPTAVPDAAEGMVAYGRTQEGAYFHGAADAPVTLIDFSDFL